MSRWLPLKVWVINESQRLGLCTETIYRYVWRGRYEGLVRHYHNSRVILVDADTGRLKESYENRHWTYAQATQHNVSIKTIYEWLKRGKLKRPALGGSRTFYPTRRDAVTKIKSPSSRSKATASRVGN